jgi:hypothetical protein
MTERCEVPKAVSMKTPIYRDVMLCKLVNIKSRQQDVTYQMTRILIELLTPLIAT